MSRGLSSKQLKILELANEGLLTNSFLEKLYEDPSAVRRACRSLEKRGLLKVVWLRKGLVSGHLFKAYEKP